MISVVGEVAGPALDAESFQLKDFSGQGVGGERYSPAAADGGDLDRPALPEPGLWELQFAVDVQPPALEGGVSPHREEEVKIAGLAAREAFVSLALETEDFAVLDAGWNPDSDDALLLDPADAPATGAAGAGGALFFLALRAIDAARKPE